MSATRAKALPHAHCPGSQVTWSPRMSQSAISELGNMISGNASTILYNQGVRVDITPPKLIQTEAAAGFTPTKALTIPLMMEQIGQLDIKVLIS